jgi:signal transduction histidine kinase
MPARSRFSHRHLLALSTFLVPLAVLAVLGWSELRRTGATAQAALQREGRQFLASAKQAIEQRLDQVLPRALEETKAHLESLGPVRTTLKVAALPDLGSLRGIVLLGESAQLTYPKLPGEHIYLPGARDRQRLRQSLVQQLQNVDLLLHHGRHEQAVAILQPLVRQLAEANPEGVDRVGAIVVAEAQARLQLAAAQHVLGRLDDARAEFQNTVRLAGTLGYPRRMEGFNSQSGLVVAGLGLMAETAVAELSGPDERLKLLRAIAEDQRELLPDGFLSAVAHRLAASFAADDRQRSEVEQLLDEEDCRAAIRSFAAAYEVAIKPFVGRRTRRSTSDTADSPIGEPAEVERLVSSPNGFEPVLVCIRPATLGESRNGCARVALHFDLRALLGETWARFRKPDGTFTVAISDPDDYVLADPPPATPPDLDAPQERTHDDLTLRAFPAQPARFLAEAEAAANKRTLLMLALFVTALGGALWSWRSVTREAELAAMKVDLVSRVSHELKTPLALVRMYGETLGMGRARDPAQAAEFGGIIAREAERLTALIQRILDFSRQQAGTLTYEPTAIDLGELLRGVVETYAPHLESRGVILVDTLPLDIRVHCDANAAESAVVNLLENAAKYGVDGESEHEVELELMRQGDRAVIEVRDRGRGIPAAECLRVFDGFYRASNAGEVRGAGLGLSLVLHFARAHGGDVQALPRDGGGTVMRLVLPLAPAAPTLPAAGATASEAGPRVPTAP